MSFVLFQRKRPHFALCRAAFLRTLRSLHVKRRERDFKCERSYFKIYTGSITFPSAGVISKRNATCYTLSLLLIVFINNLERLPLYESNATPVCRRLVEIGRGLWGERERNSREMRRSERPPRTGASISGAFSSVVTLALESCRSVGGAGRDHQTPFVRPHGGVYFGMLSFVCACASCCY